MVLTTTSVAGWKFDESLHRYFLENGVSVPSVTQILKANGFVNFDNVDPAVLERKRQIGTLVHRMTELYDNGEDFNDYNIPDVVMPFCEGWAHFRWDSGFEAQLIEHQMIGKMHGMVFGMKVDVVGVLDGDLYVIEKKCGSSESPAWGLQTAFYDVGLHGRPTAKRAAVQLGPQFPRGYKLFPYPDASDYQIASAALAQTVWKQNKGFAVLDPIPERECA